MPDDVPESLSLLDFWNYIGIAGVMAEPVPLEIYNYICDYAYEHGIYPKARLFPITEHAVLKHLQKVSSEI